MLAAFDRPGLPVRLRPEPARSSRAGLPRDRSGRTVPLPDAAPRRPEGAGIRPPRHEGLGLDMGPVPGRDPLSRPLQDEFPDELLPQRLHRPGEIRQPLVGAAAGGDAGRDREGRRRLPRRRHHLLLFLPPGALQRPAFALRQRCGLRGDVAELRLRPSPGRALVQPELRRYRRQGQGHRRARRGPRRPGEPSPRTSPREGPGGRAHLLPGLLLGPGRSRRGQALHRGPRPGPRQGHFRLLDRRRRRDAAHHPRRRPSPSARPSLIASSSGTTTRSTTAPGPSTSARSSAATRTSTRSPTAT